MHDEPARSRIVFAYDGSLNGDCVARYAIQLATRTQAQIVHGVHIEDGREPDGFAARIDALTREGEEHGVEFRLANIGGEANVTRAVERLADDPGAVVVCGLRARETGRGLLRGTISAELLSRRRVDVIAVRVASPGLLGAPRKGLCALSTHPRAVEVAGHFLPLFAPGLRTLDLMTVMSVHTLRYPGMTPAARQERLVEGQRYLERMAHRLHSMGFPRLDSHVAVDDDIAIAIADHAVRIKAQIVFVGASLRSRSERMLFGHPLERLLHRAQCDVAVLGRRGHQ